MTTKGTAARTSMMKRRAFLPAELDIGGIEPDHISVYRKG